MNEVDILVLLKVVAKGSSRWKQIDLAYELDLSPSVINRALKLARNVRLYSPESKRIDAARLGRAIIEGASIFMPVFEGEEVRGMKTASDAEPLAKLISSQSSRCLVWPDENGEVRGLAVRPLHGNVPKAARRDPVLYELLALVDALRLGGSRETEIAGRLLAERLEALQK